MPLDTANPTEGEQVVRFLQQGFWTVGSPVWGEAFKYIWKQLAVYIKTARNVFKKRSQLN